MSRDSPACGKNQFSLFHTTHPTLAYFSWPGHHFAVCTVVELNVTYTKDGLLK
jgi:hypothetical protein